MTGELDFGTTQPEPAHQVRLARFPRRLNAISADSMVLFVFSALVYLFPLGSELSAVLRFVAGITWLGGILCMSR